VKLPEQRDPFGPVVADHHDRPLFAGNPDGPVLARIMAFGEKVHRETQSVADLPHQRAVCEEYSVIGRVQEPSRAEIGNGVHIPNDDTTDPSLEFSDHPWK